MNVLLALLALGIILIGLLNAISQTQWGDRRLAAVRHWWWRRTHRS